MGIKFYPLASGSSGNCHYVGTGKVNFLIDAGLSGKRIENLLSDIGICPTMIDFILVTHEHTDHIKGVGVLSRRYDIPVYANGGTWAGMDGLLGEIKPKNKKTFKTNDFFHIRDLDIYPFDIFHDAMEPVGFCIYSNGTKLSVLTDTGLVNNVIKDTIKDSSIYLIESNHDMKMLQNGKYPSFLKARIAGPNGHLSNEDAGYLIADVIKGNGETVFLGHLSKENNSPDLAYETVKNILEDTGLKVNEDISLEFAFGNKASIGYNL